MKHFLSIVIFSTLMISCGNSKNETPEEKHNIIIVNNEDEIGKHGEGTYINNNSERKCQYCGRWVHRDNIHHGFHGECIKPQTSGTGNQYGEGYEQGQEDARNGLASNPSGYGGNGQFEKGYEDGYNDY